MKIYYYEIQLKLEYSAVTKLRFINLIEFFYVFGGGIAPKIYRNFLIFLYFDMKIYCGEILLL